MYISKVEYLTSPEPCGKEFTDKVRCNDSRFCTSSEFQICLGPIRGQNVGSIVASRSKTSKQNLTIVAVAVTVAVAETVVSSVVVGVGLSLPLGNMDGSSGVGDVPSGTSVGSSNSGDGSGGNANGGEGGGG